MRKTPAVTACALTGLLTASYVSADTGPNPLDLPEEEMSVEEIEEVLPGEDDLPFGTDDYYVESNAGVNQLILSPMFISFVAMDWHDDDPYAGAGDPSDGDQDSSDGTGQQEWQSIEEGFEEAMSTSECVQSLYNNRMPLIPEDEQWDLPRSGISASSNEGSSETFASLGVLSTSEEYRIAETWTELIEPCEDAETTIEFSEEIGTLHIEPLQESGYAGLKLTLEGGREERTYYFAAYDAGHNTLMVYLQAPGTDADALFTELIEVQTQTFAS